MMKASHSMDGSVNVRECLLPVPLRTGVGPEPSRTDVGPAPEPYSVAGPTKEPDAVVSR